MEHVFDITAENGKQYKIKIRLAKDDDLEQIISIEQTCFPPAEAAKPEDFKKRYAIFKENFVVAESVNENKIIGFINGCTTDKPELPDELYHDASLHKPNGDFQTVFGLDVLPEYRKRGVAGELMKYLLKITKERGRKGAVLTCKDYLVKYYEKFGYKHMGVSKSSHGGAQWNDMVLKFE